MHRLVPVVVALLTCGSGVPAAAAQTTPPAGSPAGRACTAPPLTSGMPSPRQSTPVAGETTTTTAMTPGSEAPLPSQTPPAGTPVGTAVLERIRAAEENLSRCFTAGDYLAFTSLFTPRALRDELGVSAPGEPAAQTIQSALLRKQILSVRDAQTHPDGRVSADVVFTFDGQRMRVHDIFVETDGWLLLDGVIELPLEAATAATPVPLNAATVEALTIMGFPPGEEPSIVMTEGAGIPLQPGGTTDLALGVFDYEVCGTGFRCFVPVVANATWSVAPAGGARIDPTTGMLTIDPGTPSGSIFAVRADVERGRHVVETQVHVYTREANPLIGYWQEVAQLACDSGAEVVPEEAIEELIFFADGTFTVTWFPFESYKDYWGTYTFDLAQGTLELIVTGGNTIPADVDGQGRFALDTPGQLLLTDLWLGTPTSGRGPANCGHRFVG